MRKCSFLVSLAVLMMTVGCETDKTPANTSQVELFLRGTIASLQPSTRVAENGFEANDKVGVYVSATGSLSSSSNMLNNEAFTYSSGNLTAPEGKEVYWGTPDVRLSVWAYYPYAESIVDNTAYPFDVYVDQSTSTNFYNSDFITAQAANLAPQTSPVNLTFNHSLSKISISLTAGEGITADELAAAEKSFSIGGLVTTGTIDLATGVATAGETKATITPLVSGDTNYSAIVYPQQGEVTFRLELDENIYTYTTIVDYIAGKENRYAFTIDTRNPQQMSLASITINNWDVDETPTSVTLSDIITFNDENFKNYLLQAELYGNITHDEYGNWTCSPLETRIDANNDGKISIAEAEKVVYINVDDLGFTTLNELHHFTNLQWLKCDNYHASRSLQSLDVSKNPALQVLECANNHLKELNISNNTALVRVVCAANDLTSLNTSNNSALEELWCQGNAIVDLDLSNNTQLISLWCYRNELTSLNISYNLMLTNLLCRENKLNSIDLSHNSILKQFDCAFNQLEALDISKNLALEQFTCDSNLLNTLDVSNNIKLGHIDCGNNQLTELDLSCNTELWDLSCQGNQLITLDVSHNTKLIRLLCSPMATLTTIYIPSKDYSYDLINIPDGVKMIVKQ